MTRQEIDTLWYKAMHDSIRDNEDFVRYHFFKLAVAAEREECAKVCNKFIDRMQEVLTVEQARNTNPYQVFYKANAAKDIQNAIRARGHK